MCADGELVGLAGVFGVLAHGGGQFLHRGGGFFQVGGLLLGTARQITVARGDFAGGQGDAGGAGLDLADDLGQLRYGGVGVVAHAGEHAVELAVHACGQVAGGDRLQQLRKLAEVAVGHLHHGVQVLDHQLEVVLETLGVAALAEVTRSGGLGQLLDLRVDRQQAGLGRVHRFVQDRAAAGQAARILGQIADGVLVEHVDGIADRVQVLEDDRVDAAGQLAVDTREVFRDAVADVRAGMHLRHQLGLLAEAAQHGGHLGGGSQHLAGLILAGGLGADAEVATGDGLDRVHGLAERAGDGARDDRGQRGCDQRKQHDAADDGDHAGAVGGIGGGDLAVHQAGDVGAQRFHRREQFTTRRARLLVGNLLREWAITGSHRFAHRLVGGEVAFQLHVGGLVQRAFPGQRRQRRVRRQFLVHGPGGVVHALVVVGHLVWLVKHAQQRQLVGAELAQLRAGLAQVLDRRNIVAGHLAKLRVCLAQAQQCEGAEDQGHQRGEGEPHGQLGGDGQILEPLHAGCSRWAGCRRSRGGWGWLQSERECPVGFGDGRHCGITARPARTLWTQITFGCVGGRARKCRRDGAFACVA